MPKWPETPNGNGHLPHNNWPDGFKVYDEFSLVYWDKDQQHDLELIIEHGHIGACSLGDQPIRRRDNKLVRFSELKGNELERAEHIYDDEWGEE